MSNIDSYKKIFYGLMESTMGDVKPILTEVVNIEGRDTTINDDGTVTIKDKKNIGKKIRMYITVLGMDRNINVVNIQPANGGYNITGRSGNSQFVDNYKIGEVIQFVDGNAPDAEINSGSPAPNLLLKKV